MALVDQYGKELQPKRPILEEVAVSTIRDRYSNYPSHGLTPERLATIFKEADQGDVLRQSELFEEMEEKDCHLGSTLNTRKLAITGLEWEILPASESAEDKKIAEACKEGIEYIENWEEALLDILDATGKGFSVSEILWELDGRQVWVKDLKWVHQKRFTFNSLMALLEYPRLLSDAQPALGEELLPNKFVVHRFQARSGTTARGGLLRPCGYMYLFKNYDVKDWMVFNELFAVPMRVGKYKAGSSPKEIDVVKQAVFNLGVDAAAVVSDTTIIELLESKLRGDVSAFKDFAEFCDKAISKIVLGHTGSAESTPGKLGSEDQAREVRQDLLEADAKALQKTIKTCLLRPWVGFNFGWDKGLPNLKFHYETGEDLEAVSKVYGTLVSEVGFKRISLDHIYERFGIPEPEAGEETLEDLEPPSPDPDGSPSPAGGRGSRAQRGEGGAQRQANKLSGSAAILAAHSGLEARAPSGQAEIDDLADSLSDQQLQSQMAETLKPVFDLIQAGTGYHVVMAKLIELHPQLDTKAVEQLLERAIFAAEVWGRLQE